MRGGNFVDADHRLCQGVIGHGTLGHCEVVRDGLVFGGVEGCQAPRVSAYVRAVCSAGDGFPSLPLKFVGSAVEEQVSAFNVCDVFGQLLQCRLVEIGGGYFAACNAVEVVLIAFGEFGCQGWRFLSIGVKRYSWGFPLVAILIASGIATILRFYCPCWLTL